MADKLSVNELALRLFNSLSENADYYGVDVETSDSGVTLVDAGIKARGGFQAGLLITEISMGGCAEAQLGLQRYGDATLPTVAIHTDHPVIATLGSQYAGWKINENGYFAIGSGPARALALKPRKIFDEINYRDTFDTAIVLLEADSRPPAQILKRVADDCHVPPSSLKVILAPTASVAGETQISGRILETGIHKLRKLGMNPNAIREASGTAPVPPVHPKFSEAMARTNDSLLYGGSAFYMVEFDDDRELESIVSKTPSSSSYNYGKSFAKILVDANNDFYKIDPNLFAPAVVTINNIKTGTTFVSGNINEALLKQSLGLNKAGR